MLVLAFFLFARFERKNKNNMCKMHKSNLANKIKSKKMTMEQVKKGKSNVKRDSIIKAS